MCVFLDKPKHITSLAFSAIISPVSMSSRATVFEEAHFRAVMMSLEPKIRMISQGSCKIW